jgi:hypothetical protein
LIENLVVEQEQTIAYLSNVLDAEFGIK